MFVTAEFARTMLCPDSGAKRKTCVAEQCMAWRGVRMFLGFVDYGRATGEITANLRWTLQPQEGAIVVDAGFCGKAGPPHFTVEIVAPLGYDETSVPGLMGVWKKATNARSINKFEKELMKRQGKLAENDDGHRSPTGQFHFIRQKERANARKAAAKK